MALNLTYPNQFTKYISLVDNQELKSLLKIQEQEVVSFLNSIPDNKRLFSYAVDKWTTQEVVQHVIDAERVFAYRALAFSRQDTNTLPSFDENNYSNHSNANDRQWNDLVQEFAAVRKSTQYLYDSFSTEQLQQTGKASNYEISVNALGYLIAGHLQHHLNILTERYL